MTQVTLTRRVSLNVPSVMRAAAAAAVMALSAAGVAHAQQRVGSDGHYNDASNRVGSGGYNGGPSAGRYQTNINSQISTGNVSGLNYFHGQVGTSDPNALHINTGSGNVQAFSQYSAPINYAQRSTGAPNFVPYYNQAQYAPTQGTQPLVGTQNKVGLVPAPTVSPLTPTADTRLQNLNNSPLDTNNNLPTRDQATGGAGPVNPVGNPSLYSMSPLYGVRQIQPNDVSTTDSSYFRQYGTTPRTAGTGPKLDAMRLQQMRNELNDTTVPNGPGGTRGPTDGTVGNAGNGTPGVTLGGPTGGGAFTGQQVPNAQATGVSVPNQTLGGAVDRPEVATSATGTLGSVRQNLMIAPGQQSQQLAELQKRFTANTPHPTAAQSAQQMARMQVLLNEQRQAMKSAKSAKSGGALAAKGTAGTPDVGGTYGSAPVGAPSGSNTLTPATPPKTDLAPIVQAPDATSGQPYVITSLAGGIRAKGLADLLRQGEEQMRSGQFAAAVDKYDSAAEVAPNNPFVPLGRGFAELGASYYGKAESDLTRAIMSEPALLAGQYDLKGFLGETRLKFVQNDLADIAKTEQTARPHLLLAYIAHNTGQDDAKVTGPALDAAAAHGGNAQLIGLMREAWNLKAPAAK